LCRTFCKFSGVIDAAVSNMQFLNSSKFVRFVANTKFFNDPRKSNGFKSGDLGGIGKSFNCISSANFLEMYNLGNVYTKVR